MKRRLIAATFVITLIAVLFAVPRLQLYVAVNEDASASCTGMRPLLGKCPEPARPTRANERIGYAELPSGTFVGIALSGGGSRAANFSAAILLELERLGFLKHASIVSSVSGSSLTAAYYGLFSNDRSRWNEQAIRAKLMTDFESQLLRQAIYPQNLARLLFTDMNRTLLMSRVFDATLFEHRDFRAMPLEPPQIFINATQYNTLGFPWVFSDQAFAYLGSRLDAYPVSLATMASAAFPGAFHNVTLAAYRQTPKGFAGWSDIVPTGGLEEVLSRYRDLMSRPPPEAGEEAAGTTTKYLHVYDAGASDNLGINYVLDRARGYYDEFKKRPDRPNSFACFVFLVDAYPTMFRNFHKHDRQTETTTLIDYLMDTNALDASDILLAQQRRESLKRLNLDPLRDTGPLQTFQLTGPSGPSAEPAATCQVWHLSLERLRPLTQGPVREAADEFYNSAQQDIYDLTNHIDTRFVLTSPLTQDRALLQNALFLAARFTLTQDKGSLEKACQWFKERFGNVPCSGDASDKHSHLVDWYASTAERGLMSSQFTLGRMYEAGVGVDRSCKEAKRWYERAAAQRNVGGLSWLALLHINGTCEPDIPIDREKAVQLYLAAAEQGFRTAQRSLGILYVNGIGVPLDYSKGYFWYLLAAANGDPKSAVFARNLELRMTAEQIAEARRLAGEWKPKPKAIEHPLWGR